METFCRFLTRTALQAGWRVTVALSGENIYDSLQPTADAQLRIDPVNWLDLTCAGDREYIGTRILERRRWFRRTKPDVALFVQSSNTPFRASILAARLARVPVISTHRTMAWPIETCPSRRHFFGLLPGLGLHARRLVLKTWLTGFLADRVVYNSTDVAGGYETIYHYPRRRSVVIPNGVTPASQTTSPSERAHPLTIGFVGRLGGDKRLDVLLRAVAAMRSDDARVAIYGEGPDKAGLTQLAGEVGIAHRVEWRGVTHNPAAAYADMDIIALCSPRESSSNMILEAMAAGKAVVAAATGGMPELVDHGRCGLCVPPLDVPALAAALDRLADDAELRQTLGEQARLKALNEHDPGLIGRRWMSLLSEVAGIGRLASRRLNGPGEKSSAATPAIA
jgi:glycosyltransferase involved in cell wall biosynthesis